jgi:signal transduction histidine kinase
MYFRIGLPIPVLILCLRTVDKRWPLVEALLWIYLAAELTVYLWMPAAFPPEISGHWLVRAAWSTISAIFLFAGAALIACAAPRPLRWSHYLQMAGLAAMALFLLRDLARYLGWVDLSPPVIRHWHVPIMVLALGAAIFEQHVANLWRVERLNIELEQRIAQKAGEIEAYYAREQGTRKAAALALERQRILEDMHDGLGSSLISLLQHVQSGRVDAQGLEQRVHEALQEMRIAVDALQPRDGDLAAVLGNLRYRVEKTVQAAGVKFS